MLQGVFITLATRLTDGFSANIRLHSFARSGVSAGGRPGGLPSALARSWQAFMRSLVESESDARRFLGGREVIGALRVRCIGCWMCPSGRITAG